MLSEGAFKRGSVIAFKGGQAGVEQLALRDYNHVEPVGDLVTTKNLSYQSFSSIALNGAAKFSGGCDAQSVMASLVPQDEHGEEAAVDLRPTLIHRLEFGSATNSLVRTKPHLLAAHGQPFSTLGTATFQHEASVFRAHSYQKPVRALPSACVRLKCPFALHVLLLQERVQGQALPLVRVYCPIRC
jgi:hypothetical protein